MPKGVPKGYFIQEVYLINGSVDFFNSQHIFLNSAGNILRKDNLAKQSLHKDLYFNINNLHIHNCLSWYMTHFISSKE